MFKDLFSEEALSEAWRIIQAEFLTAIWETVYVTVLATVFAVLIGLPLGVLLVVGEKGGVLPLPKWMLKTLNLIINLLRSVPFLILMILYHTFHSSFLNNQVEMCHKFLYLND